jgi:hypothetical protein
MPVDYTIAARNAQLNNTPTDFTNMLAQYQMMGSRAQQNELAQLQMQKLQQEQERQNALSGVLSAPNFNLMSPQAVNQVGRYNPELGIQLSQALRSQQHYGTMEEIARRAEEAKEPLYEAQTAHALKQYDVEKIKEDHDYLESLDDRLIKAANSANPQKALDVIREDAAKKHADLLNFIPVTATRRDLYMTALKASDIREQLKPIMSKVGGEDVMITPAFGTARRPVQELGPSMDEMSTPPIKATGPKMTDRATQGAPLSMQPEEAIQVRMKRDQQIYNSAPFGKGDQAVGKMHFYDTISDIGKTFKDLAVAGGITIPGETTEEALKVIYNKSAFSNLFQKLDASKRRDLVSLLETQIISAVPQLAQSAGLQNKQFDTEKEAENLRKSFGDPNDPESIRSAFLKLNNLNKLFGTGVDIFNPEAESRGLLGIKRSVEGRATSTDRAAIVDSIWGVKR